MKIKKIKNFAILYLFRTAKIHSKSHIRYFSGGYLDRLFIKL